MRGFRGRVSFARGNTAWSRQFNSNLENARRGFFTVGGPSQWRMASMMAVAGESPLLTGFAEQFRDMLSMHSLSNASGLINAESELETDDEVSVSTDPSIETFISNLMNGCMSPKTWSICWSLHDIVGGM